MSAAAKSFRPQLETLEDRQLMSCTHSDPRCGEVKVSFDLSETIMYLNGGKKANRIEITDDGSGGVGNLFGTVDGVNLFQFTNDKAIRTIVINTGKGADTVIYNVLPADPGRNILGTMALKADLGDGNDTFSWAMDNTILAGGFYDFEVRGGKGNDVITSSAQATDVIFSGALLSFFALGQDGHDVIRQVQTGFLGQSCRRNAVLDGGRGNDVVSVDARVNDFSLGRLNFEVLGGIGFDRLDLVTRNVAKPNVATVAVQAVVDGGLDTRPGYRELNPRQWEDIIVSSNVILRNVDPRSRITTRVV